MSGKPLGSKLKVGKPSGMLGINLRALKENRNFRGFRPSGASHFGYVGQVQSLGERAGDPIRSNKFWGKSLGMLGISFVGFKNL